VTPRRELPRNQVRRLPEKQNRDRAALDALLDAALVAHVAVVDPASGPVSDGGAGPVLGPPQPYVLPMGFARDGDRLLLHGSAASRLVRALAAGAATCVTVSIIDGLVLARSQFESSMNYRSAMVLGACAPITGEDKAPALSLLTERLMPGRSADARSASAKELAATTILGLPIVEWSLKVSASQPDDEAADLTRPVWAGVVPIRHTFGEPIPAPSLAEPYPVPDYVAAWPDGRT
jgi:uncharacterized protein